MPRSHARAGRRAAYVLAAALVTLAVTPGSASPSRQRFRDTFNPREGYLFGASMSSDGSRVLIGEPGSRDPFDVPVGGVSLWEHTGQSWDEIHFRLTPSDAFYRPDLTGYGSAVALSGDTAVVAADGRWGGNGGVLAYDISTPEWSQGTMLLAGTEATLGGVSVAVEAEMIVVGLPKANGAAGEARVFVRGPIGWSLDSVLRSPTPTPGDRFGAALSLHGDSLLVGAPGNNGAAHAFLRSLGGWKRPNVFSLGPGTGFGTAVAQRGTLAAVGGPDAAIVQVYERGADGTWSLRTAVWESDGSTGFGAAVSIGSDGQIVVGAPRANAAYQFTRALAAGASTRDYGLAAILQPEWPGSFGASVSFTPAGILVGAPDEDPGASGTSGWVYAFDACAGSGQWSSRVHDDVAPAVEGLGADAGQLRHANCSAVRRVERLRF